MERKNNFKRIEISQSVCNTVRDAIIASGLYYIVPKTKYQYYAEGSPQMVLLPEAQREYFGQFASENGQIGVDLETTLSYVVDPGEIGLDEQNLKRMETGLANLVSIPEKVLKDPAFLEFVKSNVSEKDARNLEIDLYDAQRSCLNEGTIMRADLLINPDGQVFSCDPNLVPLGYSITSEIASGIEEATKVPVGPDSDYIQGLANMASRHPGKINGIVTSLNYPNWTSHKVMCEILRKETGSPYFVIPTECMTQDGKIDIVALNRFNRAFDIPEISEGVSNIPGVVVRYAREQTGFQPETEVVGAPGIRLVETQLWGGLIALNGFEEIARGYGITKEQIDSALDVITPTMIARRVGGCLEIATGITKTQSGVLELTWEILPKETDPKNNAQGFRIPLGSLIQINCQEKPAELCWYIKTLSTSGKKGVNFTNDGNLLKMPDKVLKIVDKMSSDGRIEEGKMFLVQPKIRSVIKGDDGNENRTKIDLFVSLNTGKTVLIDYMATPISQRAAHGSAATRLGLVIKNGHR